MVVDGRDQGPGPIRAGLTRSGPDGWAYQSGMSKAYPEVTHTRAVLLLDRDLLLVADTLRGTAAHDFNQLWHLFPGARLRLDGLTATALDERGRPALRIVQAPLAWRLEARRYFGERSPMQGWYSDRYERKRENHVVGYATRATGATFLTLVASDPYASRQASVTGRVTPAGTTADVCMGAASYAVTLGGVGLPGESVTVKRLGGAQAAERCSSRPAAAR